MALSNTPTQYGHAARSLHWLTAALVIVMFPLGLLANELPFSTDAELVRKAFVFSVHKTLGVFVFGVSLVRILWAFAGPKPVPLHPNRKWEIWTATTVHWMLYAGLIIVPLSGWLHHAATTGFAPIWWPFGQTLPYIPQSPNAAKFFASWHWLFTKVLGFAILLHVAGAVKHTLFDRDDTLARMLFGAEAGTPEHRHPAAPAFIALSLWFGALLAASAFALPERNTSPSGATASGTSDWVVEQGVLTFEIRQLGQPVEGAFGNWTAAISFNPESSSDTKGNVSVVVDIASLSLGTVTAQAMGPDFFDTTSFATAHFEADIAGVESDYRATGTLTIKGSSVPVALPFNLQIVAARALASGSLTVDRRLFDIGTAYAGEASLGFPVTVSFDLAAVRR